MKPGMTIKVVCIKVFICPKLCKVSVSFSLLLLNVEENEKLRCLREDNNLKMIKLQDKLMSLVAQLSVDGWCSMHGEAKSLELCDVKFVKSQCLNKIDLIWNSQKRQRSSEDNFTYSETINCDALLTLKNFVIFETSHPLDEQYSIVNVERGWKAKFATFFFVKCLAT